MTLSPLLENTNDDELLKLIDGSGSNDERGAISELKKRTGDKFSERMFDLYKNARRWPARSACVFYVIRYARNDKTAVKLGRTAIFDKAYGVRYRACMLLAYSLDRDSIPFLIDALEATDELESCNDLLAAIDSIESKNSDFFLDRDHSGRVHMEVR